MMMLMMMVMLLLFKTFNKKIISLSPINSNVQLLRNK
jgi:hypothetical protein